MEITDFKPYTIIAQSELDYLYSICASIPKNGDIIVAGTWRGGDAAMFCHYTENKVIVIDSFAGISKPLPEDGDKIKEGLCAASIVEFMGTQMRCKTDMNRMIVYPMLIDEHKIKEVDSQEVSLLWLDLDVYSPTKICLEYFMPKLLPDGICLVHDYFFQQTPGIKKACDELGLEFEHASGGIWKLKR